MSSMIFDVLVICAIIAGAVWGTLHVAEWIAPALVGAFGVMM